MKGLFEERSQVGGMRSLVLELLEGSNSEIVQKENQRGQGSYVATLATKREVAMPGEPTVWPGNLRYTPSMVQLHTF